MHQSTPGARRAGRLLGVGALLAALVAVPTVATTPASAAPAPLAAVDVAAAGSSLAVAQPAVTHGGSLAVQYATDRDHAENWIGIYRPGQTPSGGAGGTPSIIWSTTPGATGEHVFDLASDARLAPGDYELHYLHAGGYEQLAAPVAFTIEEAEGVTESALAPSADAVQAGETLSVAYSTDAPHERNWIGVYVAGQTPGPVPSRVWDYAPGASGTLALVLDLAPGDYELFYLAQDGYDVLAGPVAISVVADPAAPVAGDPNAPVTIDPVATDVSTDGVLAREGFDAPASDATAALADGWATMTRGEWTAEVDQMRGRFSRAHGDIAVADAQQAGGIAFSATLGLAPVDVSGLAAVRLTFDSHYRGAAGQAGVVLASFDGGEPTEVLRLDETTVVSGYDETQMNARQDVVLDVPAGASEVAFTWTLTAGEGGRYWAIDSATVHQVQQEVQGAPTQAWVVSDIQGHPADLQHGIGDLAQLAPGAEGLLMVGDIVHSGTVAEWQEVHDVMDATAAVRPEQTIAAIGNHERYAAGGFEANRDRFLAFAERDRVYDEYVLEGAGGQVPVIVLGQELAEPTDVAMSDAQVAFLEERLAHWTALDRQVVVLTHFPLGETTSGTWAPNYSEHHQMDDRLTSILGNHPNAVVLSGHTHYPAEQGDWAMQRRTDDGHADGFWSINTMAMHVEWDAVGEDTATRTEVTTGDVNRGSVLEVHDDRLVVTAYDFAADAQLQQVTIPNPLVPFDEQVADVVPSPEPPVDPQPTDEPAPSDQPQPTSTPTPVDEADAAGGSSGSLPRTGADVAWLVALAAAALAAIGGGLLTRRRGRRA
ncbi:MULTISPECIES: DUF4073 domain-containing protein [unclassified Agrococcus]|uniref:metallophosphoesterase family protein n=1 Tax=unclassified Agrococcus TaxID=2615065 RepID=UPI00360F9EC2